MDVGGSPASDLRGMSQRMDHRGTPVENQKLRLFASRKEWRDGNRPANRGLDDVV